MLIESIFNELKQKSLWELVKWVNEKGHFHQLTTDIAAISIDHCITLIDILENKILFTISNDNIETLISKAKGKTVSEKLTYLETLGYVYQLSNALGNIRNNIALHYYTIKLNQQKIKLKEIFSEFDTKIEILKEEN